MLAQFVRRAAPEVISADISDRLSNYGSKWRESPPRQGTMRLFRVCGVGIGGIASAS